MPEEAFNVQIVAELTVDSNVEKVTLTSLSMSSCIARVPFRVKRYQPAILRLFEDKGNGELTPYNAFKTIIESYSQKKSDPEAYYANIKFKSMVKASYGVIQSLQAAKRPVVQATNPTLRAKKNSLRAVMVKCYLCGHAQIPFWVLQSRCMVTKNNIFGVPNYMESYPKKDFCDYNLIRVVTCPTCFFASSDMKDFQRETESQEISKSPFNARKILTLWNETLSDRNSKIKSQLPGFFAEERTLEQSLLSYDLGVIASDEVFKANADKDPRHRDYSYARKSVNYLMFKAALLMASDKKQEAEKTLQEASQRLEDVFLYLRHEPSIKVGYLLGMINLYFGDYKKVGQYMNFLQTYNKNNPVKVDSSEYKTLEGCKKKLSEAYQSREEYFKDNMKGFQKPF